LKKGSIRDVQKKKKKRREGDRKGQALSNLAFFKEKASKKRGLKKKLKGATAKEAQPPRGSVPSRLQAEGNGS